METQSRRNFAQAAALCAALGGTVAASTALASESSSKDPSSEADSAETEPEKKNYGPLQIERFDHMHYIPADYDAFVTNFERFLGQEISTTLDNSQWSGSMVAYEAYPIGVEAFLPVYDNKGATAHIGLTEGPGVAALTFKVKDIKEAERVMEEWGYEVLERTIFEPIYETFYDTKADLGLYIELIEYPGNSVSDLEVDY